MTLRIANISDLHLTRQPSMFRYNWEITVELIREWAPDLVICSGDIAYDGPSNPDDLAHAREELDRIGVEWLAIPGNHDIGDNFVGHTPVDERLLARYRAAFGADFWVAKRGGWLLVGLNAQLHGTGLAGEAEQIAMLSEALRGAAGMPVAVFNHKALHLGDPEAADPVGWTVPLPQRAELRELLTGSAVRLYASGHFHRYREMEDAGMRLVWAPSPAFITNHPNFAIRGGVTKCGFLKIELGDDGSVATAFADDNGMIQFDVQNAINDGGAARRRWAQRLTVDVRRADGAAGASI